MVYHDFILQDIIIARRFVVYCRRCEADDFFSRFLISKATGGNSEREISMDK